MKVLKRAKSNRIGWTQDLSCTEFGNGGEGCESLLRVKFKDLVYYPGVEGESWGSREPAVSFRCPVCEKCTDIGREIWPKEYKNLPEVGAQWYKTDYKQTPFENVDGK